MTTRRTPPLQFTPRLLRIREAAAYVGVRETRFRELVYAGQIQQPTAETPPRWKREHLDAYVDDLPLRGEKVPVSTPREVRAL